MTSSTPHDQTIINIKYNKQNYEIILNKDDEEEILMQKISSKIRILQKNLKLIAKGKLVDAKNVRSILFGQNRPPTILVIGFVINYFVS